MKIEYIDQKIKTSFIRHLNLGDVFVFEPDTDNIGTCIYLGENDNGLEHNFLALETDACQINSISNKKEKEVRKLNAKLVVEI